MSRLSRRLVTTALVLAAAALGAGGCATLDSLTVDIATHGQWPAGRAPGSYRFDRLPSQLERPEASAELEAAAAPALAAAGFVPAAQGSEPEVLVQLALRTVRVDPDPWADPLWWRGQRWLRGTHIGAVWIPPWPDAWPRVDREVALLIRDRASGRVLFEARARHESHGSAAPGAALFKAALADFPRSGPNPRQVQVSR